MRFPRLSEPRGAATARFPCDHATKVRAPLFNGVIEQIAESRRSLILDMGPVRPQLLSLLQGCRCRVLVADLAEEFAGRTRDRARSPVRDIMRVVRNLCQHDAVDIVLTWDCLNYLERTELASFMDELSTVCRPGALVHAFVIYAEQFMPQSPGQLDPVDAGHFRVTENCEAVRVAPRYTPEDLRRCAPAYNFDRMRLLSNGMQEYLLRLRE